jgi:arginyl-tRNA synthetase
MVVQLSIVNCQLSIFMIEQTLKQAIASALGELYNISPVPEVNIAFTKKEHVGDFTLVVFSYLKASGKPPEATAEEIGNVVKKNLSAIQSFNVVKGFLNFNLTDEAWNQFIDEALANVGDYVDIKNKATSSKYLMVEYSSPNTNKPLHLGHIRNNLIGYSVAEILKAAGNKVVKANLVNDRGIHICKSMLAWQKYGHGETPESTGVKGDHLVGKYYVEYDRRFREEVKHLMDKGMGWEEAEKEAPLTKEVQEMLRKWEAGDKETIDLWKTMNGWVYKGFEETYKALGVDFDKMYYESETYIYGKKIIEDGLSKGVFYKKDDGSVWVDLTDVGLDQKVLLRSDGTAVYMTQDLGTAQLRFDEYTGLERLIYVVGNEQDYHFKVLKEIFKKMGRPWAEGLYHLSYGMVDLPSGKMKSREGTVVDADDLIKEINDEAELTTKALGKLDDFNSNEAKKLYHAIAMGALKYFILKVDPKKRMLFNPTESIDLNGNTGPFIQYTFARISSVLRKGKAVFKTINNKQQTTNNKLSGEKNLIKILYQYPAIVKEAANLLSPALVANYVYEVAKTFNHFYHDHIIVDETNKDVSLYRLNLSNLTAAVIKECLHLLGIEATERM